MLTTDDIKLWGQTAQRVIIVFLVVVKFSVNGWVQHARHSSHPGGDARSRFINPSSVFQTHIPQVAVASSSAANNDLCEYSTSDSPLASFERRKPSEAHLTVVQITDVYTLENFGSLKTMLVEARERLGPSNVVSVLTGDFLAPYLLSSIDSGAGMMKALAATPVDFLTWGNHEADVDHRTVCRHVREFPGTWLNSNMQDHEAMEHQKPFDVIEVTSEDGTNVRRIGLVAVLSDDPALYSHFGPPGAFGGATIRDPWETLEEYKELLEGPDYRCDVVLPLQHTYSPDDHRTCREFDFPVVLSGHDHHIVDEVVAGTRLLKPGSDGVHATVLDISWDDADSIGCKPIVNADIVEVERWPADRKLFEECRGAYDALSPLRNTELARVPLRFEPLSSAGSRERVCTMGRFLCSILRSAMNTSPERRRDCGSEVDAVLLMGGNVRGGTEYPEGSFFSLEALEAEVRAEEVVGVVPMPGWLLSAGAGATHAGDPIPGWIQHDEGVRMEHPTDGETPFVTHVRGEPIDPDRIYLVATKISDLTNGQSPPWTDYFTANPSELPRKGAYVANIHAELMGLFARNLGHRIWQAVCIPHGGRGMEVLDHNGDGFVTVDQIQEALRDVLGLSVGNHCSYGRLL